MAVGGSLNAGQPPWGGSPNKCLMEMSISYFFHRAQSGQVIRSNGAWIILSKVTFCNFGNGRVPHIFNLSRATRTYGLFQQSKHAGDTTGWTALRSHGFNAWRPSNQNSVLQGFLPVCTGLILYQNPLQAAASC